MPRSGPPNVRWLIVCLLIGFAFLGHFNRVSISVAGSERFLKGSDPLSKEQMGVVYSAFLLVYTIGMLPGGWLIDRFGPTRALTGMGLGMGFCVILTGMLGWLGLAVSALWIPLLLVRSLAGGLSVPLHPAAARSVSLWLPTSSRSTANGLITAGALVGIALTYPVFGWLMDKITWPWSFVVCGATFMVFALIWSRLASDAPRVDGSSDVAPRSSVTAREFLGLFGNRSLVLLTLSYAAVGYFQYLFFYWIQVYFNDELHLDPADSRQAAFTVTIAMAVGMAGGGWLADRACALLGRRFGCLVVALVGMGLSSLFGCLGIATKDPEQVVWFFSLALGSLGLCEGIFWTTGPILVKRNGGLACAFLNTGGNAGGLLAPVLTPWLAEEFGWTTAIVVACIVCAAGGVLWIGIRPTRSE